MNPILPPSSLVSKLGTGGRACSPYMILHVSIVPPGGIYGKDTYSREGKHKPKKPKHGNEQLCPCEMPQPQRNQ